MGGEQIDLPILLCPHQATIPVNSRVQEAMRSQPLGQPLPSLSGSIVLGGTRKEDSKSTKNNNPCLFGDGSSNGAFAKGCRHFPSTRAPAAGWLRCLFAMLRHLDSLEGNGPKQEQIDKNREKVRNFALPTIRLLSLHLKGLVFLFFSFSSCLLAIEVTMSDIAGG